MFKSFIYFIIMIGCAFLTFKTDSVINYHLFISGVIIAAMLMLGSISSSDHNFPKIGN